MANQHRPWTDVEDYYILDHPDVPAWKVGESLGRTYDAVRSRRARLKAVEPVTFSYHPQSEDPFSAGKRRVVAATCIGCGLLLDGKWFRYNQRGFFDARCKRCTNKMGTARRSPRAGSERHAHERRLNNLSRDHAHRSNYAWTADDERIIADNSKSLWQMSVETQRTLYAVRARRTSLGLTDPHRLGDPSADIWVIRRGCAVLVAGVAT